MPSEAAVERIPELRRPRPAALRATTGSRPPAPTAKRDPGAGTGRPGDAVREPVDDEQPERRRRSRRRPRGRRTELPLLDRARSRRSPLAGSRPATDVETRRLPHVVEQGRRRHRPPLRRDPGVARTTAAGRPSRARDRRARGARRASRGSSPLRGRRREREPAAGGARPEDDCGRRGCGRNGNVGHAGGGVGRRRRPSQQAQHGQSERHEVASCVGSGAKADARATRRLRRGLRRRAAESRRPIHSSSSDETPERGPAGT